MATRVPLLHCTNTCTMNGVGGCELRSVPPKLNGLKSATSVFSGVLPRLSTSVLGRVQQREDEPYGSTRGGEEKYSADGLQNFEE